MKLFWATTPDGYENWFVIAETKKGASEFHELAEGFNLGYAKAHFICEIPEKLIKKYKLKEAGWPAHELIKDLGGKLITESNPRKVNFNGRIFIEGTFSEGIFLDYGNLNGVYILKIQNSNKYKFGKTSILKNRINQFKTGNPDNIKIVYFIETPHYHSLEKHLKKIFKGLRTGGEWFSFNNEELEELEANLEFLQSQAPNDFKIYNIKAVSIKGRVY